MSNEILQYYEKETKVPIRKLNPVKDASDTEIALRLCLDLGRKNILILGATGAAGLIIYGRIYNV